MEFCDVINNKILKRKTITSYGLIVYTIIDNKIYYLLGKLRDTISFKQFINLNISDEDMKMYLDNMTKSERTRLLYDTYNNIIDDLVLTEYNKNKLTNQDCSDNFELYRSKYVNLLKDDTLGLDDYPYIFPKGRKKKNESELECAIREFHEETKIASNYVSICDINPIEEIYHGLDGLLYKTVYYVGYIKYNCLDNIINDISKNFIQTKSRKTISDEISKIKWLSFDVALNNIDKTKQYILKVVNNSILVTPPVITVPKRRYSF